MDRDRLELKGHVDVKACDAESTREPDFRSPEPQLCEQICHSWPPTHHLKRRCEATGSCYTDLCRLCPTPCKVSNWLEAPPSLQSGISSDKRRHTAVRAQMQSHPAFLAGSGRQSAGTAWTTLGAGYSVTGAQLTQLDNNRKSLPAPPGGPEHMASQRQRTILRKLQAPALALARCSSLPSLQRSDE